VTKKVVGVFVRFSCAASLTRLIFPDNLIEYPFQGGGCYLLLGTVELTPLSLTILKMAKLPLYLIQDILIRKIIN
jgi:hypothetical protein